MTRTDLAVGTPRGAVRVNGSVDAARSRTVALFQLSQSVLGVFQLYPNFTRLVGEGLALESNFFTLLVNCCKVFSSRATTERKLWNSPQVGHSVSAAGQCTRWPLLPATNLTSPIDPFNDESIQKKKMNNQGITKNWAIDQIYFE